MPSGVAAAESYAAPLCGGQRSVSKRRAEQPHAPPSGSSQHSRLCVSSAYVGWSSTEASVVAASGNRNTGENTVLPVALQIAPALVKSGLWGLAVFLDNTFTS